jgi:hypothetical protein
MKNEEAKEITIKSSENSSTGEIVLFQPNDNVHLEVFVNNETVWLTQQQIADLFGVKQPAVSKHLKNIFASGELEPNSVYSILEYTANDGKIYNTQFYNLDAILSIGYRVNSMNATKFRIWANKILKDYILKGYAINQRFERIEQHISQTDLVVAEHGNKIDFFVRSALPPVEGIFYDGQVFDAYAFVADLVRSAKKSIVLIDNYVDESVLLLLSKRLAGVEATIYTSQISVQLQLDLQRHNAQYPSIELREFTKSHDRFLIVDNTVYHIGASLKDLGKKWFAFCKMDINANLLLGNL